MSAPAVGTALIWLFCLQAAPGRYQYVAPPKLDDGLATGTLAQAKLNPTKISALMERAASGGFKELHSLLVYRHGRLVLEEYFAGNNDFIRFEQGILRDRSRPPIQWSRTEKHYVASVNKALTATLVGIALAERGRSVHEPISLFLPTRKALIKDVNKAAVTVWDLLNMRSGFEWDEWTGDDLKRLWQSKDFTAFLLARPNAGPMSRWRYCSAGPNVLIEVVETLVGGSARDWAREHLYAPLRITDYTWESQPNGLPEGSARMYLRPRDLLKVGVAYLNGGMFEGEQVLPAAWVKDVFRVQTRAEGTGYSHGFWHRELNGLRYISADGDGGQYLNLFPEQDLIIVMTQGNYLEWPLYADQAKDVMGNYLLPALDTSGSEGAPAPRRPAGE